MTNEYKIETILWEDHWSAFTTELPDDIDDISPTISFGVVIKETDKTLLVAHDIEKDLNGHAQYSYTVILKSTIVGRKENGTIPLDL